MAKLRILVTFPLDWLPTPAEADDFRERLAQATLALIQRPLGGGSSGVSKRRYRRVAVVWLPPGSDAVGLARTLREGLDAFALLPGTTLQIRVVR